MDTTLSDPLVGQVLDGRYAVQARIARGGMATVYTALDTRLDRTVALKVMHPALADDEEFVRRFIREAKAAARLSHPHVVSVYDQSACEQGRDGGEVFLVMEYVPGRTLRDLIRDRGRLSPAQALEVLEPVLAALAAAHQAGLVHRDVKPENVLLADDGRVKVADFGLARAAAATTATTRSVLIGTVAYLAPEQVARGVADARADVYAAGTMLYEMLTGSPPYDGETPMAVAFQHVHREVPAPSERVAGIPAEVDALVTTATRRDPDARFADAGAFLHAVDRVRRTLPAGHETMILQRERHDTLIVPRPSGPSSPTAASAAADAGAPPTPRTRRQRTRRRLLTTALALLLLATGTGGWWLLAGRYTAAPALLDLGPEAAAARAKRLGFVVRVGGPGYSETVRRGLVFDQSPDPGERIRKHGAVVIHLSRGPERYAVPDLRGAAVAAAREALAARKLRAGTLSYDYADDVARDRVVAAAPKTGTLLKPQTVVNLVVSKGPRPVAVPNVTARTVAEATRALTGIGLRVATTERYDEEIPKGTVLEQSPSGGTALRGDTVRLVVSKGPQLFPVPNVVDLKVREAKARIKAAGFEPEISEFPGGPNRVLNQSPAAGSMAPRGATVTLYAF